MAAAWLLFLANQAPADFAPPQRLSAEGRTPGAFAVGIDYFGNLVVVHEETGTLVASVRGPAVEEQIVVGPGQEPSLAFTSVATVLAHAAPATGGARHRIVVRQRSGPRWNEGVVWSMGEDDDRWPCLQLTDSGEVVLTWERRLSGAPSRILFRRSGFPEVDLGRGERPSLALDATGRAHVAFLRDDDIHAVRESAAQPARFPQAVNVTVTPFVLESYPRLSVAPESIVHLCFERQGEVYLANDRQGPLGGEILLATAAASPSLAISANGALAVGYASGGDIHTLLGTAFAPLPAGSPLLSGPQIESDPAVAVDTFANLFVVFRRDGALYYSTDAGPPQAAFDAEPLRGEAPLNVTFRDRSTGAVTGWAWDFGDKTTSGDPNPVHTYTSSGEFLVRLRVSGPGGESPLSFRRTVLVQDPSNEMRIAPVSVFPGQKDVHIPILTTHNQPAQGFTIAATYDPLLLRLKQVKFEQSNLEGIDPELFVVTITEDPEDAYFTAGILFDIIDPFDGRTIPPGIDHRIANIVADVSPHARPGTVGQIALKNQLGKPPLNNIFTVDGFSVLPVLGKGGTVTIRKLTFPPPRFFVRGDADSSTDVNLTDAISILAYLFTGGAEPACADAADVGDDGAVDVSDAVYLLNFLFKSGSFPAPPYPDPGLDATDDLLEECRLK